MKALSLQLQIQIRMNPLVNAAKGKLETAILPNEKRNCSSIFLKLIDDKEPMFRF